MFELIYKMLQQGKYYGVSKEVDVAKGINKIPTTIKDSFNLGYRLGKSKNYKIK